MRRQRAPWHAAAVLVFIGAAASAWLAPAHGQTLDLGKPASAPAPGAGEAALGLAQALKAEADQIARDDRVPAPDTRAARIAFRRLAAELLATGERAGEPGSGRILLGRKLARARTEFDATIAARAELLSADGASLWTSTLAADLERAAKLAGNPLGDAWLLVRDALASITVPLRPGTPTGARVPWGWTIATPSPSNVASARNAVQALAALDPSMRDALVRAIDATEAAESQWPVAASSGLETRARLGAIMSLLASPPAWLDQAATGAAAKALAYAAPRLGDPASSVEARLLVARLDSWRQLVTLAQSLAPKTESRADITEALARTREAIVSMLPTATSGATLAQLAAAQRHMRLALELREMPEEKTLPRQLRLAWRTVATAARATEGPMLQSLPDLLRGASSPDPATVARLGAHRAAIAELARLGRVATMMSAGPISGDGPPAKAEGELATGWARVADRMLKLGQESARPGTAGDAARAGIRELTGEAIELERDESVERLAVVIGLPTGDPARAAWDSLTGGRTATLRAEIATRRDAIAEALQRSTPVAADDRRRLALLRRIASLASDLEGALDPGTLDGWAGWEMSSEARQWVTRGVADAMGAAVRAAIDGDERAAVRACDELEREHATALLMGRLARERRQMLPPRASAASGPVPVLLLEIGSGPGTPGASWRYHDSGPIADVCRYTEEVVALARAGKKNESERLGTYVDRRAREILNAAP